MTSLQVHRGVLGVFAAAAVVIAYFLFASAARAEPVLCPGNLWYPGGVCPKSTTATRPPPPLDPSREVYFNSVKASGEVHLERAAGGALSGQNIAQVRLKAGDKVVTGPTGHARLELTDGSVIELDANTDVSFEDVADWSDPMPFALRLLVGFAHFTHMPNCDVIDYCGPRVKEGRLMIFSGTIGIRGTEFEMRAEPDGNGYVKLISGKLEITPDDGGEPFTMSAGDTIRFSNFALTR
jgi:ferric-dicitrate binding protein FerR (iron transport regulator)